MTPELTQHLVTFTRVIKHIDLLMTDISPNPLLDMNVPEGLRLDDLGVISIALQEKLKLLYEEAKLLRGCSIPNHPPTQPQGEENNG